MKYNIEVLPLTTNNLNKFDQRNIIENFSTSDPLINNKDRKLVPYLFANNIHGISTGAGKYIENQDDYKPSESKKFYEESRNTAKETAKESAVAWSQGGILGVGANALGNELGGDSQKVIEGGLALMGSFRSAGVLGGMGALLGVWSPSLSDPASFFSFNFENPEPLWVSVGLVDCEDGWDWGSVSCSTVSTDVITTHMSIWRDYRTNECDIFGPNSFDPMISENYPEGRYYCDNSIHEIKDVFRKNKDVVENLNKKNEFRGLSRSCTPGDNAEMETIIESELIGEGEYKNNPGGVLHPSSKDNDPEVEAYIQNRGDSKLKINYGKTCFSATPGYKNQNFPVPPIVHWDGSTPSGGLEPKLIDGQDDDDLDYQREKGYKFEYCKNDDYQKCSAYHNPCKKDSFTLSEEYKLLWGLATIRTPVDRRTRLDDLDESGCNQNPLCNYIPPIKEGDKITQNAKCKPKFNLKKPKDATFNDNTYFVKKKRKKGHYEFCKNIMSSSSDGTDSQEKIFCETIKSTDTTKLTDKEKKMYDEQKVFCDSVNKLKEQNSEGIHPESCPRISNPCKCGDDYENEYGSFYIERLCSAEECSKKKMCTYKPDVDTETLTNPKCRPIVGYLLGLPSNSSGIGNVDGYYDANLNAKDSKYTYDIKDQGKETKTKRKHERRNQYAKYIDCQRHGLDSFECNDPYPMTHLEKWCDALGMKQGYEKWHDGDFAQDYRYNISKVDMIPDDFTDDLELYKDPEEENLIISQNSVPWMNALVPKSLGGSDYKQPKIVGRPFWQKSSTPKDDDKYVDLHAGKRGHTDALPGGNNWDGANIQYKNSKGENPLLFLNRGYCPSRKLEKDGNKYATNNSDRYAANRHYGMTEYSQKTHKYSRQYAKHITDDDKAKGYDSVSKKVCAHLNTRHNEHSKALIQWKKHHDMYHKLNPVISLIDHDGIFGSSHCTLDSVNDAVNTVQLCRKYGIGGKDLGQVYFTDPKYMFGPIDKTCNMLGPGAECMNDPNCKEETNDDGDQICVAKMAAKLKSRHGEHLFGTCSSATIMDFEYICEALNIPLSNDDTDLFNTYSCNARDIIRKIKKCNQEKVNVPAGEACSDRAITRKAVSTKNQTMVYDIESDEMYVELLQSGNAQNKTARDNLLASQQHEIDIQLEEERDIVQDAAAVNDLEIEIYKFTNSTEQKKKALKEFNSILQCERWVNGTEMEKKPYKDQLKDPETGIDLKTNKKRIKELNNKCLKMEEPFPKKIIIGFCFIILIILIIGMIKF